MEGEPLSSVLPGLWLSFGSSGSAIREVIYEDRLGARRSPLLHYRPGTAQEAFLLATDGLVKAAQGYEEKP